MSESETRQGVGSGRFARLREECGRTFVLALPLVVGQLLLISMNVADTVLSGKLSTDTLAAVSMGYNAWILALLVVIGVLMAVTPAVAQLDGARRRGEVGHVFRQSLWIALGIGSLLFVGLRFADPLLELAGVAPEIRPGAREFLAAISWGAPALALFSTAKSTSEGLSLTRPTMYVSALGLVVLVPLAWALMYGRLGAPKLGAAGAGYAHATVLWIEAGAYLAILARDPRYRDARLFERFDAPELAAIAHLLKVGLPMGVSIVMEGGLFVATAWMSVTFGPVSSSAHAIALNVASVTFMVPLGIGMATTVRVGNAVGRRDRAGIAWAGASGFVLVLATQTIGATVLFVAPNAIADIYTDDAAVLALASTLLGLAAVFQMSDGVQVLFNGALRGLEDTLVPALITTLSYWGIGFTVGWWLGKELNQGPVGLWKGLVAGLTSSALLLFARFAWKARYGVR
ncbi:MAG: MATE family efflux transporter [Planctomycetes bacterium]|nr:MATE family efflux transporter [Planctomycetota bacterium]